LAKNPAPKTHVRGLGSWHRIFSKQRGIAANRQFARFLSLSGAASCASRPVHAPICRLLRDVSKPYNLCGGEGWIRTPGAASASMGGIRREFGALFGPNKSIGAGENMFALDSALLWSSPVSLHSRFADPRNLVTPNIRQGLRFESPHPRRAGSNSTLSLRNCTGVFATGVGCAGPSRAFEVDEAPFESCPPHSAPLGMRLRQFCFQNPPGFKFRGQCNFRLEARPGFTPPGFQAAPTRERLAFRDALAYELNSIGS
jgi:hypothetical protein